MSNFINQFPYTDFHELNLDWILNKMKELENTTSYLVEEFSKIEVLTEDYIQSMIDRAIETNNLEIARQLIELKSEITTEYKGYVTAQINALTTYIDNQDVHYDQLAQDSVLVAEDIYSGMDNGEIRFRDVNTGFTFGCSCSFTERQKAILKAGGLLNYTREGGL